METTTVPIPNTRWWWLLGIVANIEMLLFIWLARGRRANTEE